jgi:hypothetical protein
MQIHLSLLAVTATAEAAPFALLLRSLPRYRPAIAEERAG